MRPRITSSPAWGCRSATISGRFGHECHPEGAQATEGSGSPYSLVSKIRDVKGRFFKSCNSFQNDALFRHLSQNRRHESRQAHGEMEPKRPPGEIRGTHLAADGEIGFE